MPNMLSVIVPTKNSAATLQQCLASVQHPQVELIVIDNYSTDTTPQIGRAMADVFVQQGPERHTQRRVGADLATGAYLFFVDSDMHADAGLIDEIIAHMHTADALIIGERPHGADTFWTRVKCAERAAYAGDDTTEAARVFRKRAYTAVGGWSPTMTSCEDWDLTHRIRTAGHTIKRTTGQLWHDEGHVTLRNLWRKKAYYGGHARGFAAQHGAGTLISKLPFLRRSLWRQIGQCMRRGRVSIGLGVLFLSLWTTAAAAWGYISTNRP